MSSLDIIRLCITKIDLFSLLTLNKFVIGFFSPLQVFKKERFVKIVNDCKGLTIFAKSSISDIWQSSEYSSLYYEINKFLFHFFVLPRRFFGITLFYKSDFIAM